MRRLITPTLGIAFVLALVSIGVGSASALVLPEYTVETKATSTSGTFELGLTGANVKCKKASSSSVPTNKKEGEISTDFSECTLGGKECHTLLDTGGQILWVHIWHLVLRISPPPHIWGWWLLLAAIHIECLFLNQLISLRGNVLGEITPAGTKTNKFELSTKAKEGKQELTSFENDSGEEVATSLEGSVNGGAWKAATETIAETKLTTEKETEIVN